jgi:hypothetical protein
MRSSTRHAALRAAARLALPFTLAGCGATVSAERPRADAALPDTPAATDVSTDVSPDAATSRGALADPLRGAEASAACCESVVEDSLRADAGV